MSDGVAVKDVSVGGVAVSDGVAVKDVFVVGVGLGVDSVEAGPATSASVGVPGVSLAELFGVSVTRPPNPN